MGRMERHTVLLAALLLLAAHTVRADERIAAEEFASADLLTLGPDNVTHAALQADTGAPHPFDRLLEVPPNAGNSRSSGPSASGTASASRSPPEPRSCAERRAKLMAVTNKTH